MSEKELPPSPEKIRKALEKGEVSVSQDLVALARLGIVAELAFALEVVFRNGVISLFNIAYSFMSPAGQRPFTVQFWNMMGGSLPFLYLTLVLALVAAACGVMSTLLQTRFNVAKKAFDGSLKKLNPINNLKQIFSGKKFALMALGPLKIASVLIPIGQDVYASIPLVLQADRLQPLVIWQASLEILHGMERTALIVLLLWACFDIGLQKWTTFRSLRMTREEAKREYKEMEGDPHAKGARKSVANEELMSDSQSFKPSVVVVNPEHFAVALAYDYLPTSIPRVVGKGVDEAVLDWRKLAEKESIPVIRFPTVARQLYSTGKVGQGVPAPMLAAVALLFEAAKEAAQQAQQDGDWSAIFEVDEDAAKELLKTAPSAAR